MEENKKRIWGVSLVMGLFAFIGAFAAGNTYLPTSVAVVVALGLAGVGFALAMLVARRTYVD